MAKQQIATDKGRITEHRLSFIVQGEPVPAPRPKTRTWIDKTTKKKRTMAYYDNKKYPVYLKAIKNACPEVHHFTDAQVKIYFITARKADVDNLGKSVLDALTGELWDNDKVVWDLHLIRLENKPHGVPDECYTQIEIIGDEPEHVQAKLLSEKLGTTPEQTHDYLATLEAH